MPGGGNWRRGGESRHGAGRGGNGRFFDYGELRHVVLALLEEQPRHGYDIIRAIDQRTGGAYCPSPGVIYPTLALLQDVGHVRAETADGARNRYQITPDGRALLIACADREGIQVRCLGIHLHWNFIRSRQSRLRH